MNKRSIYFSNICKVIILLFATLFVQAAQAGQVEEIKQTFNGLQLNANLLMADGKTYQDNIILLTHGTLTHKARSTYAELQKNLASQGVSSLAINLSLGLNNRQGEYDCNVPHTHMHTDALKEIGFWFNWLKTQGAKKISLMGHSRGGNQTAWYAAQNDSDDIKNIILLAPATGEQQSATEYEEKYSVSVASILKKAKALIAKDKGDTLLKDTDFIYCKKTRVSAAAFVDYYEVKPQFDTPTILKDVKKPTLVIMGSDDDVVSSLPEKIKPLESAGKVKTIMLEDADHFFMDFANEDAATAIVEFIE